MLLKALRCVAANAPETAGRKRVEEKIVKSITDIMARIDNEGRRTMHRELQIQGGGVQCGRDWDR